MSDPRAIAAQFDVAGTCVAAHPFGHGHINDSFAVSFDQDGAPVRYLLQRINRRIFTNPDAAIENIARVTAHLARKGEPTLTLVKTRPGTFLYRDEQGNAWRLYQFLEGTVSFDVARDPAQAAEAARAFGRFQFLLADLPGPRLHETIPAFHDTPARFRALQEAIAADPLHRASVARPEIDFVLKRETVAHVLQRKQDAGEIPDRIAHNDTKLNNVLFDVETGRAAGITDLDTVMPGNVLYDFGDLVRTVTSPAAEDERDLSKVILQLPMFAALAQGYLAAAGALLNKTEKDLLAFSGKVVTLETGIRFLTDFLLGDCYFKTHRDGHNLDRSRAQFALVAQIEQHEETMRDIVTRCT